MSVPKISEATFSSSMVATTSVVQEGGLSQNAQKINSIVDFCHRVDYLKDNDKMYLIEFDLLPPLDKLQILACIANKALFPSFFCQLPFGMINKYATIATSISDYNRSNPVSLSPLELRSATIAQYIVELHPSQPQVIPSTISPKANSQKPPFKENVKKELSNMEKVLDYCKEYAPWKLENPESLPVKQCVALFKGLEPFQKIEVLDRISSGPYIYFFYCQLPQSMQKRLQDTYASVKKKYETFQDADTWIAISVDQYKRELMSKSKEK